MAGTNPAMTMRCGDHRNEDEEAPSSRDIQSRKNRWPPARRSVRSILDHCSELSRGERNPIADLQRGRAR